MKILKDILKIDEMSFEVSWDIEEYIKITDSNQYKIYTVEESENVIGFAVTLDMVDVLEIIRIAVCPDYRNKGYAIKLLSLIDQDAKDKNYQSIFLEVRSKNIKARSLYKKMGFVEITVRKKYYADDLDDAIVMQKK